jgi:hypothetical protein
VEHLGDGFVVFVPGLVSKPKRSSADELIGETSAVFETLRRSKYSKGNVVGI